MTNFKLRAGQFLLTLWTLSLLASLAPAQTYTVFHSFLNTDGCCSNYPSVMAQGLDGNIYGATTSGGAKGYGAIFRITPAGVLTDLHSFTFIDGDGPQGGITLGLDGNFYGTTYQGGAGTGGGSYGTIFKITPAGVFTHLYSFSNGNDGAYPRTPPVQAPDGNLYGCTGNGTKYALYKITTAGVFTVMASLASQTYTPLLVGTDGNLYGTTLYGGTYNEGTVFRFSPSAKTITTLYSFKNEWGASGPLVQGTDGALYGTASWGGTGSGGAIYRITTAGVYKVLYNFSAAGTTDGRNPQNGVVQGSDGFLYGVATAGGTTGQGTLFKVSTTGVGFALLHNFVTVTGDTPSSALLLHTNGTIYGQTIHGGTHAAYGTMFKFTNNLKPFVLPLILKSAKVGASVALLGQGFNTATAVTFGTTAATYTVNNPTYITAKPVAGSTTAQITVKEPGGNLLSPLKFKIVPTITSFSPAAGPVGTTVTITGMSLSQTTSVKFGSIAATSIVVNSNTQVTATVPTGAVTGKITLSTPGGGAATATAFTVQ
jgi:uncharacterized repeat protein (TIGR03803 family)